MSASLALARYRVSFEAVEPLDLPAYLGSTLRGAFGRAFRRLCCLGRHAGGFARRPDFQVLFRRLLGRLSRLARFHGGAPLGVDFRGLIDAAGTVRLAVDKTRWTRWARYSARQDRRMEWEGLVGSWPYLVFGQWTHVGSGTTFGLGGHRIEP